MSDALARLAAGVEGDPFFLAAALAVFARSEGLDDAGLAAALGVAPALLPKLKLCRPPRPEPGHFWADVGQIAGHFGVDPERLADAVRRGQTLLRLQQRPPPGEGGTLLAAREPEPPAEGPP